MSKKMQDYDAFVAKFKPKKTTDDCYTPPLVYDAVLAWARKHLDIGDRQVVRPFYPGGDYEHCEYPDGCVVIDNPPFSIFAKICDFYVSHNISFLLFAPSMTSIRGNCTYIGVHAAVIYENGANVATSFVTNMMGDLICTTAPELCRMVKEANDKNKKQTKKQFGKLSYPDCVLRASELHTMSNAGIVFQVDTYGGTVVNKSVNNKKGEFGNSILLSDRMTTKKLAAEKLAAEKLAAKKLEAEKLAAEKLAAEKLAAEKLELLDSSKEIIRALNELHPPLP